MVGNTTQAFHQYTMDISSGVASTILGSLTVFSQGGEEWSEMGRFNPAGTYYAYVSSNCTPDAPPATIANVALDLAIQNPSAGGSYVCGTAYNTPLSPMYYHVHNYVQFQDFDWGPADGTHDKEIIANVTDISTFNNIYLYKWSSL
jgi:hypothetical protein